MGWRTITIGALAAALLQCALFLYSSDPVVYILFLIAPVVVLFAAALLLLLVFRRTRGRSVELLLTTFVFTSVIILSLHFEDSLRPALRWAFFSPQFKREVVSQPGNPSGEFKHVEWDGSGGAPVGDWTSYVVFDPTDSLNIAISRRDPGPVYGVPCDVQQVRRLERHWYSVTLEMNEWWDHCRKE